MHVIVRGAVHKNIGTLHAMAETLGESEEHSNFSTFLVLERNCKYFSIMHRFVLVVIYLSVSR